MYNMPMPVSTIRTRIRQEFERHRYAKKINLVDVLLFKSHAEYQVRNPPPRRPHVLLRPALFFSFFYMLPSN